MLINHQNPSNMSITRVTRTINDPSPDWTPITFKVIDPNWNPPYPTTSGSVLLQGTQRLFEAYTPNSTKDHKTWKPFEHFKAETTYAAGAPRGGITLTADMNRGFVLPTYTCYDDRMFNYNTGYGVAGQYDTGLTPWYVPRSDGGFIPTPTNLEDLKKRSLVTMLPKIKAELSSLVSLYEAKDILSIRGTAKRAAKVGRMLLSNLNWKWGKRSLATAVLRQSADSYLQWKFNLRPLISDISGIYRIVANYERRINDFVNRSGTTQIARFRCNLAELTGRTESDWSANQKVSAHYLGLILQGATQRYFTSVVSRKRIVNTDSATFHTQIQYNYTLSAFQREHAKVLGILDMFGIRNSPAHIWNILPWSFVVDWLVDVSSWLDSYGSANMEPKVNILQYCWSIRRTRTISVLCKVLSQRIIGSSEMYPPQYIQLPDVRETSYRRGTDLPATSSFTTSGLSSTELSLGAAMMITHRRKRNTTGSRKASKPT